MSYVKVAKAPESAMKMISFVLTEDLLLLFLHLMQLEDKYSHIILQTRVATASLLYIQMLPSTDLSSLCGSCPWLDNKSVPNWSEENTDGAILSL